MFAVSALLTDAEHGPGELKAVIHITDFRDNLRQTATLALNSTRRSFFGYRTSPAS
jgi:hypothetical protein